MNYLSLIGRTTELFNHDIESYNIKLRNLISNSRILVIGGAGSIAQPCYFLKYQQYVMPSALF